MRARLITLTLLASAAGAAAQTATRPVTPYAEHFTRQFAFYPGGKVAISATPTSSVKIVGWKLSSVRVEAEKVLYRPAGDDSRSVADKYPVSVRYTPTSATVRFQAPLEHADPLEVNATIYVPATRTDLQVRLNRGDLAVSGLSGWIEATLEEGNIEFKGIQGYVSALTKLGDLAVDMSGRRWEGHSFTAATLRGGIALRLPAPYSAALQLETRDGKLTIDYPEQEVEGEKVPLVAVTLKEGHMLKATVGEGGAPLRLSSAAGDIRLSVLETP